MSFSPERRQEVRNTYQRVEEIYESLGSTYHSTISPRQIQVNRYRPLAAADGVTTQQYRNIQINTGSPNAGRSLASLVNYPGVPIRGGGGTSTAVVAINDSRLREKRELVKLNDKFAQYVEKVRFLEAQNKKLKLELDYLESRSGQGSVRIRDMYQAEIDAARRLIADTDAAGKDANARARRAEEDLNRQKAQYNQIANAREIDRKEIDNIQRKIAENEAQINLFKRRIADLEDEGRRYKAQTRDLQSEIARIQKDIENEVFLKSTCDIEKISLEDQLATLRQTHEVNMTDLRSRITPTDLDPMKFIPGDLVEQLREIRKDYENDVATQRDSIRSRYSIIMNEIIRHIPRQPDPAQDEFHRRQVERIRSDATHVQNQCNYLQAKNQDVRNHIEDMKRKIDSLNNDHRNSLNRKDREIAEARERLAKATREHDELLNSKVSLEREIRTYNDLLESQNGLRPYVDRIVQLADRPAISSSIATCPTGSTTTITRTVYNSYGSAGSSGQW